MQTLKKRWYSCWPQGVPKYVRPSKPVSEYLRDIAVNIPNKVALNFYGYQITYKELNENVDRFARALIMLGINKGDRVALFLLNCPQYIISYFGILRAGGIVVPLNPMFKSAELEYELQDCGAQTLIVLDSLFPEIQKVKHKVALKNIIVTSLRDFIPKHPTITLPPDADYEKVVYPNTEDFVTILSKSDPIPISRITDPKKDIALLLYTGGTTGLPKGALHTHYSHSCAVFGIIRWYSYKKNDVHLTVLPLFHIFGLVQSMCAPLLAGGQIFLLSRFSQEALATTITKNKCTVLIAAPTMITALVQWSEILKYDLSSLRIIGYGAAPMPTTIANQLKKLAPIAIPVEGYGMTETGGQSGIMCPPNRPKSGYIGIPDVSTNLIIVDTETGLTELEAGEEGEIIMKTPAQMKGYWNRDNETETTIRNGWVYSGDIGKMDEEGYVAVVGRKKELIKCSGFSVFPTEVEELLHKHHAVSEVAVIGVPDPYRGESPKAFIVLKSEFLGKVTEEDIIEWAKDSMSTYKRPRQIEFIDELPKNAAGKIMKRLLVTDKTTDLSSNVHQL